MPQYLIFMNTITSISSLSYELQMCLAILVEHCLTQEPTLQLHGYFLLSRPPMCPCPHLSMLLNLVTGHCTSSCYNLSYQT